jgi:hypothetical protein
MNMRDEMREKLTLRVEEEEQASSDKHFRRERERGMRE